MEEKEIIVFDKPNSVKFSINTRGVWSAEVKCHGKTPQKALKEACALIKDVEVILQEKNRRDKHVI